MPKKHLFNSSPRSKRGDLALIIDAGTTNIKVSLVNRDLNIIANESAGIQKRSPKKHWVEQNPLEMFAITRRLLKKTIQKRKSLTRRIRAIGITNQRETTVVWDRKTGKPLHSAIVWLDERTRQMCTALKKQVNEKEIRERTGLVIDPYFSAPKLRWLLQNSPAIKKAQRANRLAFGTVDSWLVFCLTGGRVHATDFTNASRTLLFHIQDRVWDQWLLQFFGVPPEVLPKVQNSFSNFGTLDKKILGLELPLQAVMGDQQAALYAVGDGAGATKITYGTGAFILQNIGRWLATDPQLFTTLAVGAGNKPVYAVEGKVSPCGDLVKAVLGNEEKMRAAMRSIAQRVDMLLQRLPHRFASIVIDGGVTRDGIMADEQARASGVTIVQQPHYEVTTIGTAKLLFDNWK